MQHLTGKWVPPVLAALAELGVADELMAKPLFVEELAERVGAQPTALYRLLRAAASIGVFEELQSRQFRLTETADFLRSDVEGSLRAAAVMFGLEPFWAPYAQLVHTVRTGEPAFDRVFGQNIYQYLEEHADHAQIFGAAAAGFHSQAMAPIIASYDFSTFGTVVDVGGGSGGLLTELLRAYPTVRGVLLEVESVLPAARTSFEAAGLLDRVELIAGDFFVDVPAGDAYLVKSCLHNFGDDEVVEMLGVLRRRNAPVLIVETMIPAGNGPHYSKFDDIEMMAIAGGHDRTEVEWVTLAVAAGFRAAATYSCDERFTLLEAQPQ